MPYASAPLALLVYVHKVLESSTLISDEEMNVETFLLMMPLAHHVT